MSESAIPTVTVRETVTATASASNSPNPGMNIPAGQSHPFPQGFPGPYPGPLPGNYPPPFIPMAGLPPVAQPGSIVSPFAAVLCILTVAGCYWAFKYLPQLSMTNAPSASSSPDKEEKDKDKDKAGSTESSAGSQMTIISPAAFISLFCFALLAIVIIRGPLGLAEAFSGKDPNVTPVTTSPAQTGQQLGVKQLRDLMAVLQPNSASSAPTSNGDPQPHIGGQHHAVGPNGAASSSWYINQGNHASGYGAPNQPKTGPELSMPDRLVLAGLPPAFQAFDLCRSQPSTCASLLQTVDTDLLTDLLSGGRSASGVPPAGAPLAKPVPLIPQHGFLGSYQGLKSLENAFYPMLIGAIGLIVLFDYGT